MDKGSHSVVKNELETSHTEDNRQVKNTPSADDLSINVKPHVIILESVPVSAEKSPVNSQETGPIPTTKEPTHIPAVDTLKKKEPNSSQPRNEIIALRSDFKKSQDLEEKMDCNISQLGNYCKI